MREKREFFVRPMPHKRDKKHVFRQVSIVKCLHIHSMFSYFFHTHVYSLLHFTLDGKLNIWQSIKRLRRSPGLEQLHLLHNLEFILKLYFFSHDLHRGVLEFVAPAVALLDDGHHFPPPLLGQRHAVVTVQGLQLHRDLREEDYVMKMKIIKYSQES